MSISVAEIAGLEARRDEFAYWAAEYLLPRVKRPYKVAFPPPGFERVKGSLVGANSPLKPWELESIPALHGLTNNMPSSAYSRAGQPGEYVVHVNEFGVTSPGIVITIEEPWQDRIYVRIECHDQGLDDLFTSLQGAIRTRYQRVVNRDMWLKAYQAGCAKLNVRILSQDQFAEHLDISKRQLIRELERAGIDWQELQSEARLRLASADTGSSTGTNRQQ